MSDILTQIPKDLPIVDPLLFSFLMIIDSAQFQVSLRGKYSDYKDYLPVFEYAVNTFNVSFDQDEQDRQILVQNITCGYWRDKPEQDECTKIYVKYPNDEESNRQHEIAWTQDFEAWRIDCFDNIRQIISALIYRAEGSDRNPDKSKKKFLADIFGWELEGDVVNFYYAINKTNKQLYGVGADFSLQSPVYDCCGKVDLSRVEKLALEDLGFKLPNH